MALFDPQRSFTNGSNRAGRQASIPDQVVQVPGGEAFNMLLVNMP